MSYTPLLLAAVVCALQLWLGFSLHLMEAVLLQLASLVLSGVFLLAALLRRAGGQRRVAACYLAAAALAQAHWALLPGVAQRAAQQVQAIGAEKLQTEARALIAECSKQDQFAARGVQMDGRRLEELRSRYPALVSLHPIYLWVWPSSVDAKMAGMGDWEGYSIRTSPLPAKSGSATKQIAPNIYWIYPE